MMKCSPGTPSASSRAHNSVANSMPIERTAAGSSSTARIRSARSAGNAALRQLGEPLDLLDVGHRHDAGDDRHVAARGLDPVAQPQIVLRLEEHLGDRVVGARAALVDEVPDVGVPVRRARVHLREGRDADAEVAGLLDQPDQVGGVVHALGVRRPTRPCGSPGGSPRTASMLRMPASAYCPMMLRSSATRVVDGGEVRDRRQGGVGGDLLGHRDGAGRGWSRRRRRSPRRRSGAPPRAGADRVPQVPLALRVLGGKNSKEYDGRPWSSSSAIVGVRTGITLSRDHGSRWGAAVMGTRSTGWPLPRSGVGGHAA